MIGYGHTAAIYADSHPGTTSRTAMILVELSEMFTNINAATIQSIQNPLGKRGNKK
jgi:hypothetical protein